MLTRASYKLRFIYFIAAICILCGLCVIKDVLSHGFYYNNHPSEDGYHTRSMEVIDDFQAKSIVSGGRHLLSTKNNKVQRTKNDKKQKSTKNQTEIQGPQHETCTPPAILEFPDDFMNNEQRVNGGFLFCVVIAAYMFWAIAIVCDDYFVPALDVICEKMNLQTDVAGATFMALGSSAPELFASMIGVFITEGDIGTGTILGSAVFNVLFVIGVCGLLSGQVLQLSWWPIVRDLMSYLLALLTLILVIMDNVVMWYEAVIMMCSYVFYLVLMFFNPQLERFAYHITNTVKEDHVPEHHLGYTGLAAARDVGDDEMCAEHHHKNKHEERTYLQEEQKSIQEKTTNGNKKGTVTSNEDNPRLLNELQSSEVENFGDEKEKHEVEDDESNSESDSEFDLALGSPLHPPKGKWKKICWSLALPINICFYLTIPDVRKASCRRWCPVAFVCCIVWIAITSYILVWMVTLIGFTFGIPDTVMGLTLVAFGSSVPDCMSSLFVARKGDGDMACSHTVGSNVFDILLCLGIPWTVKTTIFSTRSSLALRSHGLFISCFFIMASIILTFLMMHLHEWKLTKKVGLIYIVVYLIFISMACVIELNVFGYFNPPMCKIPGSI